MNKHRLHHYWRWLRPFKPRYFLLAAAICSLLCVIGLRHNNQHMVALREVVYSADKNGPTVDAVQQPLKDLQSYVTSHMNTGLSTHTSVYPPIQLQYTYQRLVAARGQQLQAANGALYTQAQTYCQAQDSTDFSGHNRVPCIEQYVQQHGASLPAIPASLYQFDFVAPKWSPDLAGWSLLATIVLLFMTLTTYLIDRRFK